MVSLLVNNLKILVPLLAQAGRFFLLLLLLFFFFFFFFPEKFLSEVHLRDFSLVDPGFFAIQSLACFLIQFLISNLLHFEATNNPFQGPAKVIPFDFTCSFDLHLYSSRIRDYTICPHIF